jgi:hypothetical protein
MPEIFRIDMGDTKATLYIAPPTKPYGTFTISYQEVGSVAWGFEHPVYADAPEYAIDFSHTDDGGVVVYTINDLRPNTQYAFRVKCANKCASTSYGSTVAASTNTLGATTRKTYTTGDHTLTRTTGVTKTSSSLLTNAGSPAGLAIITGFILMTLGVGVYVVKPRHPSENAYSQVKPRKLRIRKRLGDSI